MTLLALLSAANAADPAAPGGTLSLRDLTDAVLAANPEVEVARAALAGAEARRGAAGALADPMLDVQVAPLSFVSMPGWRVELSQPIPLGGARRSARAMADADRDAALADLDMMRLELADMAAMAWADWYVVHRELTLVRDSRRLLGEVEQVLTARVGVGRASTAELFAVRTEAGGLAAGERGLGAERAVVAVRINTLLHRAVDTPVPPPPESLALPAPGPAPGAHPAVAEAEAMGRAAAAALGMARADRLPMLGWMAGFDAMAAMPEERWMVGVSLTLPTAAKARAATVAGAQAEVARAGAELRRAEDEVAARQGEAAARLAGAEAVVTTLREELLPAARAGLDASRAAFAAGTGDLRAVLDAERALLAAESRLATAEAERALWARRVELAEGRP